MRPFVRFFVGVELVGWIDVLVDYGTLFGKTCEV